MRREKKQEEGEERYRAKRDLLRDSGSATRIEDFSAGGGGGRRAAEVSRDRCCASPFGSVLM